MRSICIGLLFLVSAPFLHAQVSSDSTANSQINALWEQYAERGDNLISDIRPKFRSVLDSHDKALESSLDYQIVITGNTNAFAAPDGRTVITSSFLQVIDSMATMMSAAQTFNKPECLGSYVDYLATGTRDNSWLAAHRRPVRPVLMAFGYWQSRPDICGGLNEATFRASQKADDLRELMIYASLIYLIGHEFTHHKFHDPTFRMVTPEQKRLDAARGLDTSDEVTPAEQIVKEKRADLFAFHKMIEMDYPPIAAMPVLVFFGGIEGFSPEQTPSADHPSAVVRFNDMIEATKEDAEFMDLVKEHHLEQQWDAFVAFGRQLQSTP